MAKLLIVEDDMILDEAYRRKFSEIYDIRIATDGEGGIRIAREWVPDIILLDIYMPGKSNGLDVLSELKKNIKTDRIPVLVITNLPDVADKVIEMGASRCFMKTDVDLDLIEKNLEEILVKSER